MFDTVKELGLQGWPAVAAITVICVSIVSFFNGWPTFITINKCKDKDEDEE